MPELNIENQVDALFSRAKPEVRERVTHNREILKTIKNYKVPHDKENIEVFGVKNVNINNILKNNLWNRSIFTTDKLCRMFLSWRYEQLKKYLTKKRKMGMNILWIIIIMMAVAAAVIFLLLFLPGLGVI